MLSVPPCAGNSPATWTSLAKAGQLSDAMLQYTERRQPVSFVELTRDFSQFMPVKGNLAIEVAPNVIAWSGLSSQFYNLIKTLVSTKQIHLRPSSVWVYWCDGGSLGGLPLAKSLPPNGFKKPRWLPVTLCSGDGKERRASRRKRQQRPRRKVGAK